MERVGRDLLARILTLYTFTTACENTLVHRFKVELRGLLGNGRVGPGILGTFTLGSARGRATYPFSSVNQILSSISYSSGGLLKVFPPRHGSQVSVGTPRAHHGAARAGLDPTGVTHAT